MKKTLFIGSTVLDLVVNLDHLPTLKEDINTDKVSVSLGGCAYNASNILHQLNLPYLLISPVGTGFFASCVQKMLLNDNKKPFVRIDEMDNGCCICLVNKEGERSFLSHHGAEYLFKKEWLENINMDEVDYVYVCGLEIEDKNGEEIIEFLKTIEKARIVFAPGSRIMDIQKERMDAILNLHPILHMNEEEIMNYTNQTSINEAMIELYHVTKETIIVTCGERGACYLSEKEKGYVPGVKNQVIDTIGAGDSHIGAVIAGLKRDNSLKDSVEFANKVSSKVVGMAGANIKKEALLTIDCM